MIRKPKTYLLLFTIMVLLTSQLAALKLPYEVLDSIVELSDLDRDFKDLTRVNVSDDRGPTRPIYRLDLDPDYVAYYEIDMGRNYVVLSSGPQSGDFREVESGPDPRPTDVLIKQAQENRQQCDKFYRLSPLGLTICKNNNGTIVAASYNWTASVSEIEDWRKLDQMVKKSFDGFKRQWRERAAHKRTKMDWATTDVVLKGEVKKTKKDEEALSPGSIVKIALGERFKSADVYMTSIGNSRIRPSSKSTWQQKLCKVLVDVCSPDGSTKVKPSAIMATPNYLLYIKLEVHGNQTFVGNVLQWHEIGFVVQIAGPKNEVIRKYFAITLHSKRIRRSLSQGAIREPNEFPDYDQHKCCGGCWSGCSPVAWAQVFGYFDRRARWVPFFFSPNIYGDSSTVAPLHLTSGVERFVEDIRSQLKTFCNNGQGSTYLSKNKLIASWFRARQGSTSQVATFLENRKKRSSRGASSQRGDRSWIETKGVYYINYGYPVIFSIILENKAGHAVVATKYKKWTRRYRECRNTQTGWWMGQKTKKVCSWKTTYDYEYYLHYGWGGSSNKWQEISPRGAYVAYISK